MRKAIAVAAMVLMVGVVVPGSALGKAGGTDRPYMVSGSGTTVSTATGPLSVVGSSTGSVRGTHIGNATSITDPQFTTITGPDSLSYSAPNVVVTAANGDQLYASQTGTGTFTPECAGTGDGCVVTLHIAGTFTGGTGRFEDASGSTEVTVRAVRTSTDGTTSTFSTQFTNVGTISY